MIGMPSQFVNGFPDGMGNITSLGVWVGGREVFVGFGVDVVDGSGVLVKVGALVAVGMEVSVGVGVSDDFAINELHEVKEIARMETMIT